MSLKWDKSLELGYSEIDDQHRSVFEHFEKLSQAARQANVKEILEELSFFLCDFAKDHFAAEEKIMAEYGYPAIELQKHQHAEFTRFATDFKEKIEREGVTPELAIEATGKLLNWIIQHIRRHDKDLVEYIKASLAQGQQRGTGAAVIQDKNYLIGRQPILNRNEEVVAYELLFRSAGSMTAASVSDASQATANVIINTMSGFGINHILGPHRGFINMELELLMSDSLHILPKERIVLELLESLAVTPELVGRCRELKEAGFILALDDHEFDAAYEELYHIAEIVKMDLILTPPGRLAHMVEQFRPYPVKLLAEKVETHEEFLRCLDLGFEYFQGYYFAKPTVLEKKSLDDSHVTLLKLMRLLTEDAGLDQIESTFRSNPGLIYKLLMLVNSVSFGLREKIQSVRHAVTILGYQQIKHWVQLALFAADDSRGLENPLIDMAAVRASFMEQLAGRHPECSNNPDAPEQAFMVGILSLLENIYNISIDELVKNLNLSEQIREALVSRTGILGKLLNLAEMMEQMNFESTILLSEEMGISQEDLLAAQVSAYSWRERIL